MIVKQDDLTEIKHIGLTRMRLLNNSGITNIRQLHEMPLEKLGEIKPVSLGQASRMDGMTPAAISILMVALRSRPSG